MRAAPHKRTALEVCALELCAPQPTPQAAAENGPAAAAPLPQPTAPAAAPPPPSPLATVPPPDGDAPALPSLAVLQQGWAALCRGLDAPLRAALQHCELSMQGQVLTIACNNQPVADLLQKRKAILREALADHFSLLTPPNLAFTVAAGYNKGYAAPVAAAPAPAPKSTPVVADSWDSLPLADDNTQDAPF